MTFTYGNDPTSSNRDAMRVLLNDTTETGAKLSDETITWLLVEHSSLWYAAAAGADVIAGQFADAVSEKQVGDLKIRKGGGDIVKQYRSLAATLRSQAAVKGVKPYSGGISISDKDSQLDDPDWDRPAVAVGMHDASNVSDSTSGRWGF